MNHPLPPRFEPFAVAGGLRGQLSELPLPEILEFLRESEATGILSLVSGGARKAVYVRSGRVVFGSSNLPNDRLGEILIRDGKITVEEYEASVKALAKGKRQGKVLVEMGAITPKDLWEGVQFQVREIVYSVFPWEDGQFQFEESTLPERERITVDLDIHELILVGIRRVDANGPIQARYPDGLLVPQRVTDPPTGIMESYEDHVLGLIDGERSVLEICHDSEIGDNETLKVLYALISAGIAQVRGRRPRALDQDFVPEDTLYSLISSFNEMYGLVFKQMLSEVGPIAENVLEKYLSGLRESRREVFAGLRLLKDGTLDAVQVERNLNSVPEEERRGLLVDSLNELLYAELLAVKRTLGAAHEGEIIRALRERQV